METMHKHPSIDQTNYILKSETPTLKETLRDILNTPNLRLIFLTNCLEWIDMFFFIHCAALFASVFAPKELQDKMGIIFTAILWTVPPLTAVILGVISDRFGRRRPIMATAFGVIILTGLLAMTPTYEVAGMWAFGLFMTIRILMSLVISGEGVLATVYSYESSKRYEDTCLTLPFVNAGEIIAGFIILTFSSALLSISTNLSQEYIVRILLIFLVCCFAFIIKSRSLLKESNAFLMERDMAEDHDIYGNTYYKLSTIIKKNKGLKREWFLYGVLRLAYPVAFTITYLYVPEILKTRLSFAMIDVLKHNIFVLIGELFCGVGAAFIIFKLETKNIFSRKQSNLFLLSIPLIGGVCFHQYLMISSSLNPIIITLFQISIIGFCWSPFVAGQFLSNFPTIGRTRLATIAWGIARILGTFILIGIMEPLKAHGHYDYFFVFFVALAIHFVAIYLSKEPTREQKLLGFDGRWMLQKKQLQKHGYEI